MQKNKFSLLIVILILFSTTNFNTFCQKKASIKQLELTNGTDRKYLHTGKLVKIDFGSADTIAQIKGRITEIGDSFIVVNGLEIPIYSIAAIYVNHLNLGNTLLTIGSLLVVFDLFEISIITHYGNIVPVLFLLPLIAGVPLVVVGLVSILHWKKIEVSKGWKISITTINELKVKRVAQNKK